MIKKFFIPASPHMKKASCNRGFSLVELIIVIAIMAILAAAIAPAVIRYIDKSRKASDVDTASVILNSVNAAYAEGYSYEGQVGGVDQDADHIETANIFTRLQVGTEPAYNMEVIAVAKDDDTFTNTVNEQQHFLSVIRKDLGKEHNGGKAFSSPKCKKNSGNGVPAGFLIGRKLNSAGSGERFEVWISDVAGNPIYRLEPECCPEYK